MKIAVAGTGGVGGYFGGMLARAGEDVWFIARGAHLAAMQRRGLTVIAAGGRFTVPPGRMTDRAGEIGPCDAVLVCVKSYDTALLAPGLEPLVRPGTLVVSLQNGIGNAAVLHRFLPAATVLGGLVYIYAAVTAPGEITQSDGPLKALFGALPGITAGDGGPAAGLRDAMLGAGIAAVLSGDIQTDIWKKFIFISAVGPMTALTRLTLGEILAVRETRQMLADAMREAMAVARAEGVAIARDFLDDTFRTLEKFDNATRSSMHYDLTHDKPLEIEAFSGTLVRLGRVHAIDTPVHSMLYAALLPYHLRALGPIAHSPEGQSA